MKGRLKQVFCHSTPEGQTNIVGIDEHGNVYEGSIATSPLANWLATNGNLTPANTGGGTGDETETRQARVG